MKTKNSLIALSLMASTLLSANVTFTNPLGSNFKSTDNGGTLPAIDAYKDGVGVIVLDNLGLGIQIDNSAMNTLVYKYGEDAKINNNTIANQIIATPAAPAADKDLASNITSIVKGNLIPSISSTSNFSMTTGIAWSLIDPGKRANFTGYGSGLNGTNFISIDPNQETNWMTWSNFVWNSGENGAVWIEITDKWRLWITPGDSYNYGSGCAVVVSKLNTITNSYEPIVNSVSLHEITTPWEWQVATETYTPGSYLFHSTCLRVDSDWFFEKMN